MHCKLGAFQHSALGSWSGGLICISGKFSICGLQKINVFQKNKWLEVTEGLSKVYTRCPVLS